MITKYFAWFQNIEITSSDFRDTKEDALEDAEKYVDMGDCDVEDIFILEVSETYAVEQGQLSIKQEEGTFLGQPPKTPRKGKK